MEYAFVEAFETLCVCVCVCVCIIHGISSDLKTNKIFVENSNPRQVDKCLVDFILGYKKFVEIEVGLRTRSTSKRECKVTFSRQPVVRHPPMPHYWIVNWPTFDSVFFSSLCIRDHLIGVTWPHEIMCLGECLTNALRHHMHGMVSLERKIAYVQYVCKYYLFVTVCQWLLNAGGFCIQF